MDKNLTKLDGGSLEENLAELKEFCGLKPDQSFQEIELDDTDEDKEKTAYETFYLHLDIKKEVKKWLM